MRVPSPAEAAPRHFSATRTAGGPGVSGSTFAASALKFSNNYPDASYLGVSFPGLCGGMSYTALDFFYNGLPGPETPYTPPMSTGLGQYIHQRQADSLLSWQGAKFVTWLADPSDDDVASMTDSEFADLIGYLDAGKPMPIGLVPYPWTLIATDAHQVVALDYDVGADGSRTVWIWDPNYPTVQNTRITRAAGSTVWVEVGGKADDQWRGFFVESDYAPQMPTSS